ncbi:unnamed protein product [Sphagnum tenellum]
MTVLIDAKHLDNAVRRSRNVANDPKTIKDYNVLVERMEQHATEWNALYQLQMQNNWDEVDAEKFDNLRRELNENVDGGLLMIKESRRSYATHYPRSRRSRSHSTPSSTTSSPTRPRTSWTASSVTTKAPTSPLKDLPRERSNELRDGETGTLHRRWKTRSHHRI